MGSIARPLVGLAVAELGPALTLPRMKPCEDCPPGCAGRAVRTNVSMPEVSRVYQGRIPGRPYSIKPFRNMAFHPSFIPESCG